MRLLNDFEMFRWPTPSKRTSKLVGFSLATAPRPHSGLAAFRTKRMALELLDVIAVAAHGLNADVGELSREMLFEELLHC